MNAPIDYERRQNPDESGSLALVCMAMCSLMGLLAGLLIGWGVWS